MHQKIKTAPKKEFIRIKKYISIITFEDFLLLNSLILKINTIFGFLP